MKSITIKGSERESVGKVATKALRNAGLVPCVIRRKSGSSFQKLWLSKLGLHSNAHTVEIDLENHLTLFYKTFKFTQCSRFYTLTSFKSLTTKKSLLKFQ
jgi:ribosomal protein L25 (general stress protein Ctc)